MMRWQELVCLKVIDNFHMLDKEVDTSIMDP
jgi:hypothetical protein